VAGADLAPEDERLGPGPRRREPAVDHELIEARAWAGSANGHPGHVAIVAQPPSPRLTRDDSPGLRTALQPRDGRDPVRPGPSVPAGHGNLRNARTEHPGDDAEPRFVRGGHVLPLRVLPPASAGHVRQIPVPGRHDGPAVSRS
jgi:hypothetical protein